MKKYLFVRQILFAANIGSYLENILVIAAVIILVDPALTSIIIIALKSKYHLNCWHIWVASCGKVAKFYARKHHKKISLFLWFHCCQPRYRYARWDKQISKPKFRHFCITCTKKIVILHFPPWYKSDFWYSQVGLQLVFILFISQPFTLLRCMVVLYYTVG